MHFVKLRHQRLRRKAVAHFPSGGVKGFSKRSRHQRTFFQSGIGCDAAVLLRIKNNMLIHLIAQDQDIGIFYQFLQAFEVGILKHHPTGIMRIVENKHPRFGRDRCGYCIPVYCGIGGVKLYRYGNSALQFDRRLISIIRRFQDDDFVLPMYKSRDRYK